LKVTIGIPTYNQAVFIEDAVRSALAQTYPDIEVVVADDCSTDNTAEVLKAYIADPRFKYVKNPRNLGRTANYKNLLYNLAQGQWFVNMDGDDYFIDTNFISNAVKLVQENPPAVAVIADCEVLMEQKGETILYTSKYANGELIEGVRFLQDVQKQQAQTTHLTTVYDREKAKAINFYQLDILSSDFESLYRLLLQGSVVYYKKPVGVWRQHGNNMVTKKTVSESIVNLQMPASVAAFARRNGVDLAGWERATLKNMMAAILVEARQEKRLLPTFYRLILNYPLASIQLMLNFSSVLKHLRPL
jgi:glycosyltransferase involved in cell wall biosynthesis